MAAAAAARNVYGCKEQSACVFKDGDALTPRITACSSQECETVSLDQQHPEQLWNVDSGTRAAAQWVPWSYAQQPSDLGRTRGTESEPPRHSPHESSTTTLHSASASIMGFWAVSVAVRSRDECFVDMSIHFPVYFQRGQ
jgi:hypothetical protein